MLLPPGTAAQGRGGIPIPGGIGIPVDAALGNTDRGWPGKGWEWSDSVSEAFPTSIIPGFHDSDPLSPSPVGAKSWKIQPFQRFFLDYELPVSCWDFRREGLIPKKKIRQKIAGIGFSRCSGVSPAIPISMAMATGIFHPFPFFSLSIKKGLKAPSHPKPHPGLLSSPGIPAGWMGSMEMRSDKEPPQDELWRQG